MSIESKIMMLASRVAGSEDPVMEFSKIASELPDKMKAAVAREANKLLFYKHHENDEYEFNVVDPGVVPEVDLDSGSSGSAIEEKTASLNAEEFKIDESMFDVSLNSDDTHGKYVAFGGNDILSDFLKFKQENIVKVAADKTREEIENRKKIDSFIAKSEEIELVEKLASMASNEAAARDIIVTLIKNGYDGIAEKVATSIPFKPDEIKNSDGGVIDEEKIKLILIGDTENNNKKDKKNKKSIKLQSQIQDEELEKQTEGGSKSKSLLSKALLNKYTLSFGLGVGASEYVRRNVGKNKYDNDDIVASSIM